MHTFSNTHIFTLASNNSLLLPFQFPFTFFLFLKKNSARNTREDYSNRASSRPDLDCQTRGKQHSISRTIWRNLRGQREHRIFRFDPARFFDRKHNTENLPSGVGRIYFACENAETFPIAGRGGTSYFPRSKNKREHPVEAGVVHRVFHKRAENAWR